MSTRQPATSSQGASSDNSRNTAANTSRDPGGPILNATTISFTGPGTIADSGNGFQFSAGDPIEVRGSPLNSRGYVVTAASAGSLTVVPAVIQTEAAGNTIIILRSDE